MSQNDVLHIDVAHFRGASGVQVRVMLGHMIDYHNDPPVSSG